MCSGNAVFFPKMRDSFRKRGIAKTAESIENTRKNGISDFTDEGSKWINYISRNDKTKSSKQEREIDIEKEKKFGGMVF